MVCATVPFRLAHEEAEQKSVISVVHKSEIIPENDDVPV
jgi:hypothetical protein